MQIICSKQTNKQTQKEKNERRQPNVRQKGHECETVVVFRALIAVNFHKFSSKIYFACKDLRERKTKKTAHTLIERERKNLC